MIETLQKEVERLKKELWPGSPKGELKFDVSLLIVPIGSIGEDTDKIILTVSNRGYMLSRVIFPKASHFEYMDLKDEMTYLYNSTM